MLDLEAYASATGTSDSVVHSSVFLGAPDTKPLRLSVVTDRNTVAAGGELNYTLLVSTTDQQVDNPTLTLTLPAGVTVLQGDGGRFSDDDRTLTWTLGTMTNNTSTARRVRVRADAALTPGLLVSHIDLEDDEDRQASTNHTVLLAPTVPLRLTLTLIDADSPFIESYITRAMPSETLRFRLVVSNDSNTTPLDDVTIALRQPVSTDLTEVSTVTAPVASCSTEGRFCAPNQFVRWQFSTVPAGESRSVLFSAPILNSGAAPINGTIIEIEALADANVGSNVVANGRVVIGTKVVTSLDSIFEDSFESNNE